MHIIWPPQPCKARSKELCSGYIHPVSTHILSIPTLTFVYIRPPTLASVHLRSDLSTYAHLRSHLSTYARICLHTLTHARICLHTPTHARICPPVDSIPERVQGQQGQLKRERLLHEFIEAEFNIDTSNAEWGMSLNYELELWTRNGS